MSKIIIIKKTWHDISGKLSIIITSKMSEVTFKCIGDWIPKGLSWCIYISCISSACVW